MFIHMVYKSGQIFLPFCHNIRVWQTDGRTYRRTDGRTDGRTEFPSLDRVCIPCSAVINGCATYVLFMASQDEERETSKQRNKDGNWKPTRLW